MPDLKRQLPLLALTVGPKAHNLGLKHTKFQPLTNLKLERSRVYISIVKARRSKF